MQQPPSAARSPFVLSLLSVIGLVIALIGGYWTFTNPNLGFTYGADAVLLILALLIGSMVLAVSGLTNSVSWRRRGGRGRQNVVSIALASFTLFVAGTVVVLFLVAVIFTVVGLA